MEVPASLAHDSAATISEGQRLWRAVARPNVMIKVPATPEGIPAIEALIAEGINVNITLMFSLGHYEAVAAAYLRGLRRNQNPSKVASVASFFVSRVDTKVDAALEKIGTPEALFVHEYGRLRSVAVMPDGRLWLTTSNRDGRGDPRPGDDRILALALH